MRSHTEPRPLYVAQAGLNFAAIPLPQLLECWYYRWEPCMPDGNIETPRINDTCQANRAKQRARQPLGPVSGGMFPTFTLHLLSLLCLPSGARESRHAGPAAGSPAGTSGARVGTGSLGAPGVPSRTGEPATEVGVVARVREGQGNKGRVLRFLLVGTRIWSTGWKLSSRQLPSVKRRH